MGLRTRAPPASSAALSLALLFSCLIQPGTAFVPNSLLNFLIIGRNSTTHEIMTEDAIQIVTVAALRDKLDGLLPADDFELGTLAEAYADNFLDGSSWNDWKKNYRIAIRQIIIGNSKTDIVSSTGKRASLHFDSEHFVEGQTQLINRRLIVANLIIKDNYREARDLGGQLMHSLQDFYSHSNWVEMGNTDTYDVLGKIFEVPSNIAPPDLQTCKNCKVAGLLGFIIGLIPFLSPIYACEDNILSDINENRILTSGYYEGQVDDSGNEILKPEGNRKCSHGGVLDGYSDARSKGGINKDSLSTLWTFYTDKSSHSKAAELATKATIDLLNVIRQDVGNDRFLQFLGIGLPTVVSLAYVVDLSLIYTFSDLQSSVPVNAQPNVLLNYILVVVNGSEVEDPFKTVDVDEFRAALENLYAAGTTSSDDAPPSMVSGVFKAIDASEPESNILVFGELNLYDGFQWNLLNNRIAQKRNVITLLVNSTALPTFLNEPVLLSGGQVLNIYSSNMTAQALSIVTGHLVHTTSTTLFLAEGEGSLNNDINFEFSVDETISQVVITFSGTNLMPGLRSEPQFNLASVLQLLVVGDHIFLYVVDVSDPAFKGQWKFNLLSTGQYSIKVTGLSTFGFVDYLFAVNQTGRRSGGISPVEGNVLSGQELAAIFVITGDPDGAIAFSNMTIAANYDTKPPFNESFPLTEISMGDYATLFSVEDSFSYFRIQLAGMDSSGNNITRVIPTAVQVTEMDLQLLLPEDEVYGLIVAGPGETIQVTVSITTLHRVTTVKLHIAPSNESYVSSISPIFFEVIDGTVMAVAEVSVPSSATNGDVSAFLVSAVNEEDKQYAVFGVFVIEEPLFNNTDENFAPLPKSNGLFQLRLLFVSNETNTTCEEWLGQDRDAKLADITSDVAEVIEASCSCGFHGDDVSVAEMSCRSGSGAVLVRGTLTPSASARYFPSELVSFLSEWVQNGTATVQSNGTTLVPDPYCPVPIESLNSTACLLTTPPMPPDDCDYATDTKSSFWTTAVVIGVAVASVVAAALVACLVTAVISAMVSHHKRRSKPSGHKHKYHHQRNEFGGEEL